MFKANFSLSIKDDNVSKASIVLQFTQLEGTWTKPFRDFHVEYTAKLSFNTGSVRHAV